MRVHWLQHVPFEGLGMIETWMRARGHDLSCTRFWAGDSLPDRTAFDWLVVMGGPMGVHDEEPFSWLGEEKVFIRRVVEDRKVALGICLGAQLLAEALGAQVAPNPEKEIGWFEICRAREAPDELAQILPERQVVFHWHGDTFAIPQGGRRLFSSRACINQGFVHSSRIIGLQFHPEITMTGVASLLEQCTAELTEGAWIQRASQMEQQTDAVEPAHVIMQELLSYLERQVLT